VTDFLLLRHAAHDWIGRGLAGRAEGIGLNEKGRAEAQELVERLAHRPVDAIYSSPRQRARETAQPLAMRRGLDIRLAPEFDEIDFGEWTRLSFEQLRTEQPHWRAWVERRSVACPPGGEPFAQVAGRALAGIERLAREHPRRHVAIFSHGDVIKAVLAGALGISLDHLERFEIAPASLSIVAVEGDWRQVRLVNEVPPAPG
jgi:broad specificity phosphatase PhoE